MSILTNIEERSVLELREFCRMNEIPKMSKARKDDIIKAIKEFVEAKTAITPKTVITNTKTSNTDKIPYLNTNVHTYMKDKTYESLISVSCGAASSNYPVVGKTIGFVKAIYREILNIDLNSTGIVNGITQQDSYILKNGDVLEFVREAGTKG